MVEFNPGVKTEQLGANGTKTTTIRFHEADERLKSTAIQNIIEEYDYDGDGKVDEMLIQNYEDGDNRVLKDSERRKFKYDEQGNVISESYDEGDDGSIELTISHKYEEEGRLIERKESEPERSRKTTIRYLDDGSVVYENDLDNDGNIDLSEHHDDNKVVHYRNVNGKLEYDGESYYGKDSNGAIIADHYNKEGYSHSTGANAYKHPNGFGLADPSSADLSSYKTPIEQAVSKVKDMLNKIFQ